VFAFTPRDLRGVVTMIVMLAVAGVISGLGERTRRQNAVARARRVQIEAERLRSSLLSAVSHDLRTPLAAIVGAGTELLQDGARLEPAARDGLAETIVEEAERLDQLVTNLLELAKLDGGAIEIRKRPEPLDEIVEVSLARFHGRLGSRPIRAHVPHEVPMVPVDGVLIQHVLINLLENALRYSPEPSPIDVEVSRSERDILLHVRDHGPGVDDAEAERLFERFYRGRAGSTRDGGVGLGLTICRAIVEAHGGRITIGNHPEGGAIVEVSLPLGDRARGLS
jgi:two-component system sensor histidine kinase KdpD